MAVKKCSIDHCYSSSSRHEDLGVTYHKFPKDPILCSAWVKVTHTKPTNNDNPAYVCSRHFCRSDFQVYQESKYVLKSGAIPSIFAWNMEDDKEIIKNDFEDIFENNHSDKVNTSNSSKESEVENLENIRRFIEQEQKQQQNSPQIISNVDNKCSDPFDTIALNTLDVIHKQQEPTVEKNIMNMILSETDVKLDEKKDEKVQTKPFISPDKGIVALTVGSKVEAKAFSGEWYPAEIVEVDYDEMEVLVHYENDSKKHDEWISVNSSRLRPYIPKTEKVEETEPQMVPPPVIIPEASQDKEESASKKKRETYAIGERCLARWRDNRRFLATICDDLGDGLYEVVFDDGFRLKLNSTRISKLKDTQVKQFTEQISVDTSMSPTTLSAVAPGIGPVASSSSPILNTPLYHTHLFDPTRDYLGSKSERREMKRKLNIKEIFNIGQKKRKINTPKEKSQPLEKKPRVAKKKWKKIKKLNVEIKQEVPDAVASIIGTVNAIKKEDTFQKSEVPQSSNVEESNDKITLEDLLDKNYTTDVAMNAMSDMSDASEFNSSTDPVSKEEEKLEKFEKPDESKHEEVLDKMKEVISKLEGGLNNIEKVDSPKTEIEPEVIKVDPINTEVDMNIAEVEPVNVETANVGDNVVDFTVKLEPEEPIQIDTVGTSSATLTTEGVKTETRPKKVPSKVKKTKKLRLLQEKKVKKQVEKVKNELEEMKRQVEEMRKAMLQKTEELSEQSRHAVKEMPESFLLPGEWCCKWVDGEPVGRVQESDAEPKVDVNNKPALPRKSVIVEDKRLPQGWKKMMVRRSLGQSAGKWDVVLISPDNKRFHTKHEMRHYLDQNEGSLKQFERGLLDFGVHLKLSRRMGWVSYTGSAPLNPSPLVRKKKLSLKKDVKKKLKIRKPKAFQVKDEEIPQVEDESVLNETQFPTIEDGYVYVGALKVQVIDNLLRCPAEGCLKNFRNNTLIKMHIKHYHRELKKMLGATPKVLDLAYARTRPTAAEIKPKSESKVIKVKIPRPPKREEKTESKEPPPELRVNLTPLPPEAIPKQEDSPKLRQALVPKPVKRPKVLLPVRRPDPEPVPEVEEEVETYDVPQQIEVEDCVDFETAISTHTVTKPCEFFKKTEKKRKLFPKMAASEEDEWLTMNSDYETQSSFPGSCTPDSKTMEKVPTPNPAASSESNEEQKECEMYMYTETGERIKIEHMKREEIINCHCGFREEDGLMVQCELCLCWQHAMCHNIHKESEVPEKYTCSICLNPKRGRRSKRFIHDQDRLYEGLLPGAKPCEFLRRSHELSGNLLRIQDALHAMRVKYYVATKKDHPKLYLWAKDWENSEINLTQERLNSDYSDLNIIINNIGKENMPVKSQVDTLDDDGRVTPRDAAQLNLSGTFSGIVPLDFPITTSDLERMARTMQEQEPRVCAPQPEAAIENGACRERLLRHVQRCQALIDARLDSIEAQVAELESQDPSFEDDETADYFPRTKQTIQMLMRDLDTMEELGVVT